MKILLAALLLALLSGVAIAGADTDKDKDKDVAAFPPSLAKTRFVFVTSYDGDQFSAAVLPEDRHAIAATQDAIERWGKWTLVYKPEEADMVVMVAGHPSEDVLAIYDAHGWPKNQNQYLWRVTARDGLQGKDPALVGQLRKAFEKAANPSTH